MKMKRLISLAIALLLVCGMPVSAFAETWYVDEGSITVNATESGQTVTQGTQVDVPDSAPVITQHDSTPATTDTVTIEVAAGAEANVTIQDVNIVVSDPEGSPEDHSGQAAVTINVADNASADVTLRDVNINVRGTGGYVNNNIPGEAAVQITGNGDVTLELDGENTLQSGHWRAGIEKNTTAATETEPANGTGKLTITDETGTSGTLEATGGKSGAGIGGGFSGSGGNITIEGSAEVIAQGGVLASGIGGGYLGTGSDITISGSAEVTATGGKYGSGIGGGSKGSGEMITVTGSAEVIAQGGEDSAGIGGGESGSGSNITISGSAEVTATGGQNGAGIGGGYLGTGSDITISGSAEVTAQGGEYGSGIGGGSLHIGSNITITGSAEVTAKGGASGAGIGGGYSRTGSEITVSQDAQVKAQGGEATDNIGAGAAIGEGGKFSNSSSDNIAGDEVKPKTNALNGGWIATYAPGTADLDTATPDSLTYKDDSGTVQTATQNIKIEDAQSASCTQAGHKAGFSVDGTVVALTIPKTGHSFTNYVSNNDATYDSDGTKTAKCDHCDATHTISDPGSKLVPVDVPQPLYRVLGQDGKTLDSKAERKDGVLTVAVDAEFASLTGSLGGINALKEQGIDTIVFVTNGASSAFALSDLLAQGTTGDSYTLTHDGDAVRFTLDSGADLGNILK